MKNILLFILIIVTLISCSWSETKYTIKITYCYNRPEEIRTVILTQKPFIVNEMGLPTLHLKNFNRAGPIEEEYNVCKFKILNKKQL